MEFPNVAHVRRDPQTGGTYEVRAYRKLTEAEIRFSVLSFLASGRKAKRPKAGTQITIVTLFGAID
jgi:hypothetical protein